MPTVVTIRSPMRLMSRAGREEFSVSSCGSNLGKSSYCLDSARARARAVNSEFKCVEF
jgi:hypothetical protein